jgi:hypothetical protein
MIPDHLDVIQFADSSVKLYKIFLLDGESTSPILM